MNMMKNGWMLTSAPCVWWVCKKVSELKLKKQERQDKEVFTSLGRLYELKEMGIITEEEFKEMKERLKDRL